MAEGVIQSYDPLAYYVNNIADLDPEVVKAHRIKDKEKEKELLSNERGKTDFDVFICVNKMAHAFILCSPCQMDGVYDNVTSKDPFQIPELLLCWRYELCFESEVLKMYKIRKGYFLFKDIKPKIDKSYYVAKFCGVGPLGLQFAALRAAPHRYNALLNDCVEFSKEFCVCLLSFCSNWRTIEELVNTRLKEISATGLSIEKLSRRVRVSGWFGNLSLGGTDVSSLLCQQRGIIVVIFLLLVFVYPIIVAVIVKKYF